jgi:hypothetical protein
VHAHFDLSILGMGLEGWILLFVVFAGVQARDAVRDAAASSRLVLTRRGAQFVRAWRLYDRLVKKPAKSD